ncbi:helix-turn-helix domain-containing protein [Sphaerisporangium album]|uniref:helix-turn-helix domain-containing protein n=1 Tax=Sphaerisporangium album TaxID=509200 RepID=UPI0015F087B4|nr:Scr1 family TA system antitoxin-like transcriptional regulator [Sphaerisporangium album]
MTIEEVARVTGVSRATITLMKSGQASNPQVATLRSLADFFKVPLGWLAGDLPEPISEARMRALIAGDLVGLPISALRTIAELVGLTRQAEQLARVPSSVIAPEAPVPPSDMGSFVRHLENATSDSVVGCRLRLLREGYGLSVGEAGAAAGVGRSAVECVEDGEGSPEAVGALLSAYGVSSPYQRETVMQLARHERDPQWWDLPEIPLWLTAIAGLESRAEMIYTYQAQYVPALLQTAQYALASCEASRSERPSQASIQFDALMTLRRQRLLEREDAPRLWAVVDESVLHRRLVAREEHLEVLDTLIAASKSVNGKVTLQVAPYDCAFVPPIPSFTLYRFASPGQSDLVCVHGIDADQIINERLQVDAYHKAFVMLAVAAIQPERTVDFLIDLRTSVSLEPGE